MGCDVHCVLQKRDRKSGEWYTIQSDILTDRNYYLFTFLSGVRGHSGEHDNICHPGLPEGFRTTKDENERIFHEDYYMGDHSFGHCTLKEFCTAPVPTLDPGDRFEVEKFETGYTVSFLNERECDEYADVRTLQTAFGLMYGTYETTVDSEYQWYSYADYRLVVGYDS
jgi:hypothetical protein